MSKIEELKKIKNLLDEGLISFEEFEKLKIRIIDDKSQKNNFQSTIDQTRQEIDGNQEILKERLEEKKCLNCNKSLNTKDLSCNSCGYNFITENIPSIEEPQMPIDGKSEINTEHSDEKENSYSKQTSKNVIYAIFGIIFLLVFGVWFYLDNKNNWNLNETQSEKTIQDTVPLVNSKDSLVEIGKIEIDTTIVKNDESKYSTIYRYLIKNIDDQKLVYGEGSDENSIYCVEVGYGMGSVDYVYIKYDVDSAPLIFSCLSVQWGVGDEFRYNIYDKDENEIDNFIITKKENDLEFEQKTQLIFESAKEKSLNIAKSYSSLQK